MKTLSIGKMRGLQQISNSKGIITVCAMDHRDSLRRQLSEGNPDAVSYDDMVNFKMEMCRIIAPLASAILLDPIYGAAQAIASWVLPGSTGLLVSMEKSGYVGQSNARITEIIPEWTIPKIKKMGASAVKLLIYFRPDIKDIVAKQISLVAGLADECIREDIPFLVEAVSYPLEEEKSNPEEFARKKSDLVLETARQLTYLPIDIFKAEFPADINYENNEAKLAAYCRELSRISQVPWVLLSAGIGYVQFKKQVEIACKAGASGFMAGRALWQEATKEHTAEERVAFLKDTTVSRFKEIAAIADKYATPWWEVFLAKGGKPGMTSEEWYRNY